jgi:Cu(I)/Ag(I) efflux system membrane fusion protein
MKSNRLIFIAAALAVAIATALLVVINPPLSVAANADGLSWQAVGAQVTTGRKARLTVRLLDANARPVTAPVTITSTRLDMAPEDMAAMQAPLRPVAAPARVFAFDTDLAMAGRWALTIVGTVADNPRPVSGTVVFTAAGTRTEASPPSQRRILYYRNPMGLPDVSPVPKKDAMGMDFVPVYEGEEGDPGGAVTITPEKIQRAGVHTERVERRTLGQSIRAIGTVAYGESRLATTTVKFAGLHARSKPCCARFRVHRAPMPSASMAAISWRSPPTEAKSLATGFPWRTSKTLFPLRWVPRLSPPRSRGGNAIRSFSVTRETCAAIRNR